MLRQRKKLTLEIVYKLQYLITDRFFNYIKRMAEQKKVV